MAAGEAGCSRQGARVVDDLGKDFTGGKRGGRGVGIHLGTGAVMLLHPVAHGAANPHSGSCCFCGQSLLLTSLLFPAAAAAVDGVRETLRLHPVVSALFRGAKGDMELQGRA